MFISLKTKINLIIKLNILILSVFLFGIQSVVFSQNDNFRIKYFTLEDGISQASSNDLLLDNSGFIWIATQDGLNKFDGNKFEHYKYSKQDSLTLSGNIINKLLEDTSGKIWVGTVGGGLNYYDPQQEIFHRVKLKHSSSSNEIISALAEDNEHNIWVGSRLSGLHKLSYSNKENILNDNYLKDKAITGLLVDDENMLWVGDNQGFIYHSDSSSINNSNFKPLTKIQGNVQAFYRAENNLLIGGDFGLHIYNIINQKVDLVELSTGDELPTKHVIDFLKNDNQSVWIGTGNGIYLFNWVDKRVLKKILYSEDQKSGLSSNTVKSLLQISKNQMLVGTGNHLNLIDLAESRFKNISKNLRGRHLLNDNVIFSIFKEKNDLWVGTSNGGLNLIRDGRSYYFKYDKNILNGFSGTLVRAIVKDDINERLWFATTRGLNMINLKTFDPEHPKFSVFKYDPNNVNSINGDYLKDIVLDKNNNLWGATFGYGIFRLEYTNDNDYKVIRYINSNIDKNTLINNFSVCIKSDKENNIWIGTQSGLSKLSFSNSTYNDSVFTNFSKIDGDDSSLANNSLYDIYIDKKDHIWLATRQGFSKYLGHGKFKSWTHQKQFTNDAVCGIQGDIYDNLWIGTNDGLVNYNTKKNTFRQFNVQDGIQSKEFDTHARFIDDEGIIYFGGIGGVTYFHPDDLNEIDKPQYLYFSKLQVKDKIAKVNTGENSILKQPLKETEKLQFKYDEFPFFLQFSSIDYRINKNVEYAYRLLPTDAEWIFLKEQEVPFLNLPAGNYTLQINGFSRGEEWHQEPLEMNIIILPPWWQTWWAYLLYLIFAGALGYYLYRFQLSRKLAVAESTRLKEVNQLKNSLYDNITHEFRTPLTVILGMADTLERDLKNQATPPIKKAVDMIHRNGSNLLSMVNEMLDLSKLESGNLELDMVQTNVIPFIKYLGESFSSFAKEHNIHFTVYSEIDRLTMDVDSNKLSSIISNLLSNAIKFSSPLGEIIMHINNEDDTHLIIKVSDTGTGISKKELPYIFNRFYQADNKVTRKREGTGIGLSLTKELVNLLGGNITVKSIVDEGSTFKVMLPITLNAHKTSVESIKNLYKETTANTRFDFENQKTKKPEGELPLVLLIEDNKDVTYYLSQCLDQDYRMMHASNGALGVDMAFEHIPDIIISDVMMPEKDGYEVCGILKDDERTDHIPIILLTAKVTTEDRITGLNHGADAYLTKPFNEEELFARLDQLLVLRKKMIGKFQEGHATHVIAKQPKSAETKFIAKVIGFIHDELDNSNFSTAQLCFKLGLSESQVYRKLKAITGKSTAIFIRSVRLQKAKEFIETTDKTVSEIAYQVGFNDPSWFSRAFKEEFGFSPSERFK